MAVLYFTGDQVAFFANVSDVGTASEFSGVDNPFLSTDIIEVEIPDTDVDADGEFDPALVELVRISVTRDGTTYDFQTTPGDLVKESGSGSNPEQGDTFFVTDGAVDPPSSGPFSDLSPGEMAFSSTATFTTGSTTTIERTQDTDFNEDGDTADPGETGDANFNIQSILVCFVSGTSILTPDGEKPIEALREGDLVETLGHGAKPIRKILRRDLKAPFLAEKHKPIEFKPGSLGVGRPTRTLAVSPQHRILVSDPANGSAGTARFVPAKGLAHLPRVRARKGCRSVEYFHLVFDRHEVIFSEGVATESFFPGHVALEAVDQETAREIEEIFGIGADETDRSDTLRFPSLAVSAAEARFNIGATAIPSDCRLH